MAKANKIKVHIEGIYKYLFSLSEIKMATKAEDDYLSLLASLDR